MTLSPQTVSLASLTPQPYLNAAGQIPDSLQGRVGIYGILDADQRLCYVGYSRDMYLSLKQHLVRQPHHCHWVKVQPVDRPSRTLLESMRSAWIAENGELPPGNGDQEAAWNQPIDAKLTLSPAERAEYEALDDLARMKFLKALARRVEAAVLEQLAARGVQMELRFNPKLKESGLLDLK